MATVVTLLLLLLGLCACFAVSLAYRCLLLYERVLEHVITSKFDELSNVLNHYMFIPDRCKF